VTRPPPPDPLWIRPEPPVDRGLAQGWIATDPDTLLTRWPVALALSPTTSIPDNEHPQYPCGSGRARCHLRWFPWLTDSHTGSTRGKRNDIVTFRIAGTRGNTGKP